MKRIFALGLLCATTALSGCIKPGPDAAPEATSEVAQGVSQEDVARLIQRPGGIEAAAGVVKPELMPVSYSVLVAEREVGKQDILSSKAKAVFGERFEEVEAPTPGTHSKAVWKINGVNSADSKALSDLFAGVEPPLTLDVVARTPEAATFILVSNKPPSGLKVEGSGMIVGIFNGETIRTDMAFSAMKLGAGFEEESVKLDGSAEADPGDLMVFSWVDYTDAIDPKKGTEKLIILRPTLGDLAED